MASLPFPRDAFSRKVWVIEPVQSASLGDALQHRDQLGRNIVKALSDVSAPYFFRDYKDSVGGKPVILLECPESVINLLKEKVPGIGKVHEEKHLATERRQDIQDYFTKPESGTPKAQKPAAP